MNSVIYEEAEELSEYSVTLRRWFHRNPEKSFGEYSTAERIRHELTELGIEYVNAGETGTVGIIRGQSSGPVIALRADIDALEISEKNDVPYCSRNSGLMHACGHDAHTAALLTAARLLISHKDKIKGTVKLIFQPAEEVGKGAKEVIGTGLLNDVQAFFGIHVRVFLPVGKIALKSGAIMGGANSLKINLQGRNGHAGRPNEATDVIVAGAEIVEALQHIVSREISPMQPAVISVCQFHSGTRDNIIAGEAKISGTVRVLSEATRIHVEEAVKRIVKGISEAHKVTCDVECKFSTDILENSPELYNTVLDSVKEILPEDAAVETIPELGTEDFSVYQRIAPTFFAFVGSGGEFPHHSSRFDIDERALTISAALHTAFVFKYFEYHTKC